MQESGAAKKVERRRQRGQEGADRGSDDDDDEDAADVPRKKSSSRRRPRRKMPDVLRRYTADGLLRLRRRRRRRAPPARRPLAGSTTRRCARSYDGRAGRGRHGDLARPSARATARPAGVQRVLDALAADARRSCRSSSVRCLADERERRRGPAATARSRSSATCSTSSRDECSSTCGPPTTRRRCWPRSCRRTRRSPSCGDRTRDLPDGTCLSEIGPPGRAGRRSAHRATKRARTPSPARSTCVLPLVVADTIRPVSGLERVFDVALLVERDRQRGARGRAGGPRRGRARADPAAPDRAAGAVRLRARRTDGPDHRLLGCRWHRCAGRSPWPSRSVEQAEERVLRPGTHPRRARGGRAAARAGRC